MRETEERNGGTGGGGAMWQARVGFEFASDRKGNTELHHQGKVKSITVKARITYSLWRDLKKLCYFVRKKWGKILNVRAMNMVAKKNKLNHQFHFW